MQIAELRILRLSLGVSLCLLFSQIVGWPMSFIAPVFTMLMLGLPVPAPRLKAGIGFMVLVPLILNMALLLLPTLILQPLVGLILVLIALFWSFYFVSLGGNALIGTFATVGIAVALAIGSVSVDAVLAVVDGVTIGTIVGVLFVWVAHALLPDSKAQPIDPATLPQRPEAPKPHLPTARWSAFRSMVITMPVALWFLLSSASASYLPVLIKSASMGQQASADGTKAAARSLLMSTVLGGVGATVCYNLIALVPSLALYVLLVAIAGLLFGRQIFAGPGMKPDAGTWSYGYLTMIVILAPALGTDDTNAAIKFYERILMFFGTTLYSVAAVYVFDAFWPQPSKKQGATNEEVTDGVNA